MIDTIQAEREIRGSALEYLKTTQGYCELEKHIQETIKAGWEKFIALDPEKKTSKTAYHYQAQYEVLKDLLEWIDEEIKLSKN